MELDLPQRLLPRSLDPQCLEVFDAGRHPHTACLLLMQKMLLQNGHITTMTCSHNLKEILLPDEGMIELILLTKPPIVPLRTFVLNTVND